MILVANDIEAENEMKTLFSDRWRAEVLTRTFTELRGTSYKPEIFWEDVENPNQNNTGRHKAHFRIRRARTHQASMKGGRNELIGTKYTSRGLVVIELYFATAGFKKSDRNFLELLAQSCFIGKTTPGGVWFRNPTIVPLPFEENYYRTNVLIEYTYDFEI